MNEIETLNHAWFLSVNALPGTPHWLLVIAVLLAKDAVYLLPVLFAGLWLWGDHRCRRSLLEACLVVVVGLVLSQLIGVLWPQPRPFALGLGHQWIPHVADASFPSNHMTVFTAAGLTLLFGRVAAWGLLTLLLAIGVAWARVFLGVHFPLDMVGAIGVAIVAWAVVTPVWRRGGDAITDVLEWLYRRVFAWPIRHALVRR